jgi:rhodanese-related sulfurtransferase
VSLGLAIALLIGIIAGRFAWFRVRAGRARALVASGAALVDVRTEREFAAGHLPGARNLPLDRLLARPAAVGPRDRAVVLYCQSGSRSGMAARALERAGFATVVNLGPMVAWGPR